MAGTNQVVNRFEAVAKVTSFLAPASAALGVVPSYDDEKQYQDDLTILNQIGMSHLREFYQWHPIKSIQFRRVSYQPLVPSFLSRHNPLSELKNAWRGAVQGCNCLILIRISNIPES